jgi:predicted ATPase/DNA-binding NarL/FixJ family response regulator
VSYKATDSQRDPVPLRPLDPRQPVADAAMPAERETLPRPLTVLIGREEERAAIRARLADGAPLLTLTGPGGVGKTRLALAVAADLADAYADGVVFVPLAAVPEAGLVLPALASALGVRETVERRLFDALIATLRGRQLLVILDNLEHVLGAAPEIARLLAACPGLTILATSRAPLNVSGEQRFQTPPLALPPPGGQIDPERLRNYSAIALFVERAREVRHDFALTPENAPAIADICQRLDGLPLAIELAAAWVRLLPLPALAAGLEQRLALLHGGPKDQPARLRTMREAIAWSYALLTARQAQLFRRLSIFVGGFTLGAAEAINDQQSPVTLDVLVALVDTSLVQVMPDDGGEPRFQLLETVREFGLEQLAASGDAEQIAAVHASVMLAFAEAAEPNLLGPEEVRWQDRCAAELGNLRAALAWAIDHDLEMALRIGGALWVYWAWYQLAEGRRWLTRACEQPAENVPSLVQSRARCTQASLAALEGDVDATIEIGQMALDLARSAKDPVAEAMAHWMIGCAALFTEVVAEVVADAIPSLDAALRLFPAAITPSERARAAYARSHRGSVALVLGDEALGRACYDAAVAEARQVESPGVLILILSDYAGWLIQANELVRARAYLTEALAQTRGHRGTWIAVSPILSLALVNAMEGEASTSARQLGAAEAVLERMGMEPPYHYALRIAQAVDLARASLGEHVFEALRAEGRADPLSVMAEAGKVSEQQAPPLPAHSGQYADMTSRERDVLRCLVQGASDKEIAAELGMGSRTVATHVATIRAKLEAPSRTAAAAIAVRDGLV